MAQTHHIFLIPGFFGFADIGGITYFHHVREFLADALRDRGIEAEIVPVSTLPTASIRSRTLQLLQTIREHAADDDAPLHLIGHSTGGLDARLFVSPTASVSDDRGVDLESFARRVRTVVTVATPHRGTPMASFFTSLMGAKLLYLLSLATIYGLRFGRLPLSLIIAIGGIVTRVDDRIGLDNTVVDQFYDQLLSDFDEERREAVRLFLEAVRSDQTLIGQLTPGGIDLFNASTSDRKEVRYASIVTKAQRPGLRSMRKIGFDPYLQASHILYRGLHWLASRNPGFPRLDEDKRDVMKAKFGELPEASDSDGVVPTLSQVWGEIIHATSGDHLDVCGHFNDQAHDPPHVDWIATGSGFDRDDFEALWGDVAAFIATRVTTNEADT